MFIRDHLLTKEYLKKPTTYRQFALIGTGVMILVLYSLVFLTKKHSVSLPAHPVRVVKKESVSASSSFSKIIPERVFFPRKTLPEPTFLPPVIQVKAQSCHDLLKLFDAYGYNLHNVRFGNAPVPRIVITTLPKDMGKISDTDARKRAFIKSLLPMILHTNEKILKDREILFRLAKKPSLTAPEKKWLNELAIRYNLKSVNIAELKKRVDIVPPSLFLAQAIVETGWGSSSAARHKKSLFGVTLKSGVKSYETLQHSVDAYIHNLNYNQAYQSMRELRSQMRDRNMELCSHALIGQLLSYCERRMWYVRNIRQTITKNKLTQFDQCQLETT